METLEIAQPGQAWTKDFDLIWSLFSAWPELNPIFDQVYFTCVTGNPNGLLVDRLFAFTEFPTRQYFELDKIHMETQ